MYAEATEEAEEISTACVKLIGDEARREWIRKGKMAERKVSYLLCLERSICAYLMALFEQVIELISRRMEDENEALLADELEVRLLSLSSPSPPFSR